LCSSRQFSWLRAAAVGFAGLWVVALSSWITFSSPYTWSDWMSSMDFLSRSQGTKLGGSHKGELPAYLRDGSASLGCYAVKIYDPVTRTMLQAEFRLQGRTTCKNGQEFEEFFRCNHHLFREQVMITLRTCDFQEAADRDLELLGKKIVSRVNRTLGRPFLESVELQDFVLYESIGAISTMQWNPPEETPATRHLQLSLP